MLVDVLEGVVESLIAGDSIALIYWFLDCVKSGWITDSPKLLLFDQQFLTNFEVLHAVFLLSYHYIKKN